MAAGGGTLAGAGQLRLNATGILAWRNTGGSDNNVLFQEDLSGVGFGDCLVWRVGPTTHGFVFGTTAASIQNGVQQSIVYSISVTGAGSTNATVFTPPFNSIGVVDIIAVVQWEREATGGTGQFTIQGTYSFADDGTIAERVAAAELGTGYDTVTGVTVTMVVVTDSLVRLTVASATHAITAQATVTITRKSRTL